jgi:hypothetical protein
MFSSKKLLFIFLFAVFLISPIIIYGTEIDWPSAPLTRVSLNNQSEFHELIAYAYGWGIGLGALLTFTMLVVAGVEWMISGSNPALQTKAKGRISSALLGLALLLCSWLILNTINPHLTVLTPLPSLWDEDMYEDDILRNEDHFPCEFVIFYENHDFSGAVSGPIYPNQEYTDIDGLLMKYQSGRAFRKITKEEREVIDKYGLDFFEGREIYNNTYIDPGPCLVTIYEEKKEGLFKKNACGKIIGTISFPNKNFAHTLFGDVEKKITCFVVEDVGQ